MMLNSIVFLMHIISIGASRVSHVNKNDCIQKRYERDGLIATKNFIFESSSKDARYDLSCVFCDHILDGRDVADGIWQMRKQLHGEFESIVFKKTPDLIVHAQNQLSIRNYRKNAFFYSCYPANSKSEIRIATLVDHIAEDKKKSLKYSFTHQEDFTSNSTASVLMVEKEIRKSGNLQFEQRFKILYNYYKESRCSKCGESGLKDMYFKCRISELTLTEQREYHLEPSASCESELMHKEDKSVFKKLKKLPPMSFKLFCNESCETWLPNLTEISLTERPSIVEVFEDDSRKLLRNILIRVGLYPVPNFIKPQSNLTTFRVTVLIDRPFTLTCPMDKMVEQKNLFFWYFNHTLLSSLKLRIMTENICKVSKNKLIFGSMQLDYKGSYICTYLNMQRIQFILSVEPYSSFDLRNPLTFYLVVVYFNFFLFLAYHLYQMSKKRYRLTNQYAN